VVLIVGRRSVKIQPWKVKVVEELKDLLQKHPVVGVADVTGIPTAQLQVIRRRLRGRVVFKVAKRTLVLRAFEQLGLDAGGLEPYLKGTIMLMFADINPFKLYRILESEKVAIEAKPGQVVDREIVVPEGPTDITPGPMLGVLGRLKIPYEVRGGKVYIKKSTVVAKPGDVISPELASVLLKLNIKPFEIGVEPLAVYDGKVVIPRSALKLDIESFKKELLEATGEALRLATGIAYVEIPEVASLTLLDAARAGIALAEALAIPTPDLVEPALRRALIEETLVLAALGEKARDLGLEPVQTAQRVEAPRERRREEERKEGEEEEKKEEVDISAGLESLFGL
jgi:large subunit ribosomal protein L10